MGYEHREVAWGLGEQATTNTHTHTHTHTHIVPHDTQGGLSIGQ